MYRKLTFYLRNSISVSFYLYKAFVYVQLWPLPKGCNIGKTLDELIASALGELSQLSGYWSKILDVQVLSNRLTKDSVVHYQSLNFDFHSSLLSSSTNSSAIFIRFSLSVNSLWYAYDSLTD